MASTSPPQVDTLHAFSGGDLERDGRSFNPQVVSYIRDKWIRQQMKEREGEFCEFRSLRLFVGTWNVNAKRATSQESLRAWLDDGLGSQPDVFAVGFQEIVDLNAANVVVDNKSQQRSTQWRDSIEQMLNTLGSQKYVLVMERHLVGIMLCVFVRAEHSPFVDDVQGETAGVGVMGVMGNKGGVAVRMQLYDSSLCFVCSHLAAHRDNVAGRNADFENIMTRLNFRGIRAQQRGTVQLTPPAGEVVDPEASVGLLQHDFVFWLGDLNYRIHEDVTIEECFEKIAAGDLDFLLAHDQLNQERERGTVFQNFSEGTITFRPTYKFQPGTNLYERRPDKKLRAPSWCDRILWYNVDPSPGTKALNLLQYRSCEALEVSDHKPINAVFQSRIKVVVWEKEKEVYMEIMRIVDNYENQNIPKVTVDVSQVSLGEMFFGQQQSRSLVIRNTGEVLAHFRFVPKLEEQHLCKPWAAVEPSYGMILPGEEMTVSVLALVDTATAHALAAGSDTLDDILILRIENGRDYFITVCGEYVPSCFGASAEELVNTVQPIRAAYYSGKEGGPGIGAGVGGDADGDDYAPLSVPKELWRLVDYLYRHGLYERGIFLRASTPAPVARGTANRRPISGRVGGPVGGGGGGSAELEIARIRNALDTGAPLPPPQPERPGEESVSVHSVAEALLSFIESLRDPLLPQALFPAVELDAGNIQPWGRRFLEQLPPVNYNIFVYLVSFLRELLQHRERNKMTPTKLAQIFAVHLLRQHSSQNVVDASGGREASRKAVYAQKMATVQTMMLHFLTTTSI